MTDEPINSDGCECCAELRDEVAELQEQLTTLSREVSKFDDWRDFITSKRIPQAEAEVEQANDRVAELEAEVHELNQRMESFIGLAEDEKGTPAKRAADLRDAMIRAAENSNSVSGGVKWWKDEVDEHLATLGHKDLKKPTIYKAMEDAAEAPGFAETTKHVRTNGRQMEVKAIRLDPAELPGSEQSNDLTTPADGGSLAETVQNAEDAD